MMVQSLLKIELNFAVLLQTENTVAHMRTLALSPSMKEQFTLPPKDNPRLINIPPRDSDEWKVEFNTKTSIERPHKRKKYDSLLENGIIL